MNSLKTYLQLLLLLGLSAVVVVVMVGVPLTVVYLWWYGILAALNFWGMSWGWAFVVTGLVLWFVPGSKFLAPGFGLYGAIYVLGWPWFWACALYVTALWILSVGGIIALVTYLSLKFFYFVTEGAKAIFTARK